MIPSLPMPPQVQGPVAGPQGRVDSPAAYPQYQAGSPGTQLAQGLTQGITGFVNNYLSTKKAKQAENDQKFEQGIQQLMANLPVDPEKLMKYAQKSSKYQDLQMTAPTDEFNKALMKQTQAQQVAQQGPIPGMPGADVAMQQAAQAPLPPQFAAPPQRSLMQKFLGRGLPTPSMQSPTGQLLQQIAQAGQASGGIPQQVRDTTQFAGIRRALANLGLHDAVLQSDKGDKLAKLFTDALNGNPQAVEMAARSGVIKDLPIDETTQVIRRLMPGQDPAAIDAAAANLRLYTLTGVSQMQLAKLNLAKDMVPRFGGDLAAAQKYINDVTTSGKSDQQPNWTPEEFEKMTSAMSKVANDHPTAPWNLIQTYGLASTLPGARGVLPKVADAISAYPRNGTEENRRFNATLGLSTDRLSKEMALQYDQLNLAKWKAVQENLGEEGKRYEKILESKDSSTEAKKKAGESLASILTKQSTIKIKYNGQDISVDPARAYIQGWGLFNKGGMSPAQPFIGIPDNPQDLYKRTPEEHKAVMKALNPLNDPHKQQFLDMIYKPITSGSADAEKFMDDQERIRRHQEGQQTIQDIVRGFAAAQPQQ